MTIVDVIDSAGEQRSLAPLREGERTWLRFLASQEARHIREQDEAAIEAEATGSKPKRFAPSIQ